MNQLYHVGDTDFNTWIENPDLTAADLAEAIAILNAKKSLLWMQGSTDSYHRDRYERDANLTKRVKLCVDEMARRGFTVQV